MLCYVMLCYAMLCYAMLCYLIYLSIVGQRRTFLSFDDRRILRDLQRDADMYLEDEQKQLDYYKVISHISLFLFLCFTNIAFYNLASCILILIECTFVPIISFLLVYYLFRPWIVYHLFNLLLVLKIKDTWLMMILLKNILLRLLNLID